MAEKDIEIREGGYSSREKFKDFQRVNKLSEVLKAVNQNKKLLFEKIIPWGNGRAILRAFTIKTLTAKGYVPGARIVLLIALNKKASNVLTLTLYPRDVDRKKLEMLRQIIEQITQIANNVNYFAKEEKISEELEL